MNSGGKIISYQCRHTGWVSAIAQTTSITRRKTACLPVHRNILYLFRIPNDPAFFSRNPLLSCPCSDLGSGQSVTSKPCGIDLRSPVFTSLARPASGSCALVGIFTPQPTGFARTPQSSVRSLSPHLMPGEESHVAGSSTIAPIRL